MPELGEAAACTLRVELRQGRTIVRNDWGFWAYPRDRLTASAVRVISRIPDRRLGRFYPFIRYEGPAQPGDLLILDRDYMSMPVEEISEMRPLMTMKGGQFIFLRTDFSDEYNLKPAGAEIGTLEELRARRPRN